MTPLHDIMTLLHDIMTPLHDIMTPLHDIMTPLHDIMTPLHDPDRHYHGQTFETLISRQRWEQTQKFVIWYLQILIFAIEWHHRKCCTPWPWLNFRSRKLITLISRKWWELTQNCTMITINRYWYSPANGTMANVLHRMVSLLNFTPWPWPTFLRSKF